MGSLETNSQAVVCNADSQSPPSMSSNDEQESPDPLQKNVDKLWNSLPMMSAPGLDLVRLFQRVQLERKMRHVFPDLVIFAFYFSGFLLSCLTWLAIGDTYGIHNSLSSQLHLKDVTNIKSA